MSSSTAAGRGDASTPNKAKTIIAYFITFEAHMIASILPAILPTVGKLVDLGFGSEAKYEIFCR
ncbi:uncharacterized protein METZ01_LOCUS209014 [marine metagenome]|uniref:Uncharacterized protein n=1 Tax=marine metagenome TaxID=408172 RepID=A0A382EZM6_9ZZZZ